jgi:hypothetical protein
MFQHVLINNLLEFSFPAATSSLLQMSCALQSSSQDQKETTVTLEFCLPYGLLIQKINLNLSEQFKSKDFEKVFV